MPPRERKTYDRSPAGLFDALLDEMQDLQLGVSSAHEANAFANLADKALRTLEINQRERALLIAENESRRPRSLTHEV
jgi:hypothetical protein